MPRGAQSRGQCAFCGYTTTKGSMPRHLAACPQRQAQISSAAQTNRKPETLYHLRMQDAYASDFWLDLEVRGSATLKDIDAYLRAHLAGMLWAPESILGGRVARRGDRQITSR